MKKIIAAVAMVSAITVSAGAAIDFDKGVDVKSAVEQAQAAASRLPEVKMGIPSYTVPDCRKVEFTAESPLVSADIRLRSLEMYQNCQNFGAPVGQACTPDPEYNNAVTRLTITAPRELKAGQKEVFEVCLTGPFLNLRPVSTVYKYAVKQDYDGFKLAPQGLIAAEKGLAGAVCRIAMDDGRTCVYKCGDGSFISRPNPFPGIPSPNQYVGPIYTPCVPTMNDIPAVTSGK
jgi:hypothetical protein